MLLHPPLVPPSLQTHHSACWICPISRHTHTRTHAHVHTWTNEARKFVEVRERRVGSTIEVIKILKQICGTVSGTFEGVPKALKKWVVRQLSSSDLYNYSQGRNINGQTVDP